MKIAMVIRENAKEKPGEKLDQLISIKKCRKA